MRVCGPMYAERYGWSDGREVKDHWCPADLFLGPSLEQYRLVANNNPGGNVREDVYNVSVCVCVCFQERGYP